MGKKFKFIYIKASAGATWMKNSNLNFKALTFHPDESIYMKHEPVDSIYG